MNPGVIGKRGEAEACRYLEHLGYLILERNYRSRYGEIDIIAKDRDSVVFVEVKTRRDAAFAAAASAVGASKQEKLRKTALLWLSDYGDIPARFDVLEIYTGKRPSAAEELPWRTAVRHIPNAF